MEIPLHPALVHFPVALWVFGSLILLLDWFLKREWLEKSAWLNLAVGFLSSIPAVVTGQNDLVKWVEKGGEVLEKHQDLGNSLPWLMGLVIVFKAHATFGKRKVNLPKGVWVIAALIIAGIILYEAHLGGYLVHTKG